jgi:uncharacterized protein YkwD
LSTTSAATGSIASAAASSSARASTAANAAHQRAAKQSRHRNCRSTSAKSHRRVHRSACSSAQQSSRHGKHARVHPLSHVDAQGHSPSAAQRARGAASRTSAAVAAVLATPCTSTEVTPSAASLGLARGAVLCLVNRVRAEHGESPLRASARLEQAAEGHCAEMISVNYFAHIAPDGMTPVDRIRGTGYIPGPPFGYVIGENLAWGTYGLSTPQSIVSAWVASPEHLANILEASYTETGVGVAASVPASLSGGAPGATYGQEFGVITG